MGDRQAAVYRTSGERLPVVGGFGNEEVGTAVQSGGFAVTSDSSYETVQGTRGLHYDVVRSYPLGRLALGSVPGSQFYA